MSDHLRAVPNPMTRAERIDFLVAHMTANPEALRAFVAEVIDDTETLAAATAEIARLRDLLGLPTIHPRRPHTRRPATRRSQPMSDPMTSDTANVIVVVRMADDLHHLLGRVAAACWFVAAFFVVAVAVDLFNRDWLSAFFSSFPLLGFGLTGRDSWTRRRKYAAFSKAVSR